MMIEEHSDEECSTQARSKLKSYLQVRVNVMCCKTVQMGRRGVRKADQSANAKKVLGIVAPVLSKLLLWQLFLGHTLSFRGGHLWLCRLPLIVLLPSLQGAV